MTAPRPAAHLRLRRLPALIVRNGTIQTCSSAWAAVHSPPLGAAASSRPPANVSFALSYALNDSFEIDQATAAAVGT